MLEMEIGLANRRLQPLGHVSCAQNAYSSGAFRSISHRAVGAVRAIANGLRRHKKWHSLFALCSLFIASAAFAAPASLDPARMISPGAAKQVEKKLRTARRRTGVDTSCLPDRIKAALAEIERRWGPVTVISAHRPGATIRGTGRRSEHADCRAADISPAPGTKAQVYRWLRDSWDGGLGIYDRRPFDHLHIDTGPRLRWRN